MHLLGRNLPDNKPVRMTVALTAFYGIGTSLAPHLLARLQIHHHCLVQDLTEPQITALSAYLSSTTTAVNPSPTPVSAPSLPRASLKYAAPEKIKKEKRDPLVGIKIETDLKKSMRSDISHLREIGSYRGRRVAQGLPVRGQRTKTNGKTAGRLNKIERRAYSTLASGSSSIPSTIPSFSSRPFSSSNVLAALRSLHL